MGTRFLCMVGYGENVNVDKPRLTLVSSIIKFVPA